jgi:hypothetical protein
MLLDQHLGEGWVLKVVEVFTFDRCQVVAIAPAVRAECDCGSL